MTESLGRGVNRWFESYRVGDDGLVAGEGRTGSGKVAAVDGALL